jgi:hypothetical protein
MVINHEVDGLSVTTVVVMRDEKVGTAKRTAGLVGPIPICVIGGVDGDFEDWADYEDAQPTSAKAIVEAGINTSDVKAILEKIN